MQAMIFAAGIGSRLKPITDTTPKALAQANGKTLLQINIEQLISFGVTDIVVNTHHFASQIVYFLEKNKNFNIKIRISDESEQLLDTGGGLQKASSFFNNKEPIILQNVDIYSNIDYTKMLEFHNKSNSIATLAIQNRESSRYLLFDQDNTLCGWENTKTDEKITTRTNNITNQLAFSGIHIISPKIFNLLPKKQQVFGIIQPYLEISKTHDIKGFLHNSDTWFDVGTPERLNRLDQYLSNKNI